VKQNISKEDYEKYKALEAEGKRKEWVTDFEEKYLDDATVCGYGVYGCKISDNPNTIEYDTNGSCD
jgi:hypothetical protein